MRGVIGLSFLAVMVVIILALTSHDWDIGSPCTHTLCPKE
jgi:hypothetical protein